MGVKYNGVFKKNTTKSRVCLKKQKHNKKIWTHEGNMIQQQKSLAIAKRTILNLNSFTWQSQVWYRAIKKVGVKYSCVFKK